jgi:serine/threonine-protein kinase
MSEDIRRWEAKEERDSPPAASSDKTVLSRQTSIGHTLPGRVIGEVPVGDEKLTARQVGRYQVLERLGEGAMASVYKAYDPSIGRSLVIKFLHAELCQDAEYRMRFLREAKAAGMLSHPNIVTVFDVGEIEGRPYIAMELLDGGPLSDLLKNEVKLPVRDVLVMGIQLANALDYAHQSGIYHRDIKPSNIIRLAGSNTIKLVDFGIAHMASRDLAGQTQVGTVMGTPHYMSPEQAAGEKVDARSDLWAVGVILYQMLCGRQPFEADSIVTLIYRISKDAPRPITDLRTDVPPALRRVVARCLNKQPDKRFQSGRELAEALERIRRDLDAASELDRAGRPRRVPLKVKLALVMAGVVALTMALTSAFVAHRQYQTLLSQTVDQGASFAKLIAVESAVPALSEDWVGIDVFVQEVARALDLRGLSVTDRAGVVRVSTDAKAMGQTRQSVAGEPIAARDNSVAVQRQQTDDGPVFTFESPIRFQDKLIGKVQLALPEEPLVAVARQAWWLMLLLLVVTAGTVMLATYLLVERYSRPLQLLRESMEEIGYGRFDIRIAEQRNDEIGELFRQFDAMAASLEERSRGDAAPASKPTHAVARAEAGGPHA